MSQSLNSNDSMTEQGTSITRSVDVAIVGAGFAGLYLLQKFRQMGLSAQVFEAGDGVGGTWYWNRYPGARCDAESMAYSYSFSPELEQEWEWTERYATQAEILRYINHVADRFELWSDIKLETRVTHVNYSDESHRWSVKTDKGDEVDAQFCIMATGCLSTPQIPNITNLNDFAGPTYYASQWPHEGVDFTDKTVGIVGTGSSAIQAIPVIAQQAKHLTVFQRTPNFSVPANNAPLDPKWVEGYKKNYPDHREDYRLDRVSSFGDLMIPDEYRGMSETMITSVPIEEARETMERYWQFGGAKFIGAFIDTMVSEEANAIVADFVREKIRQTVDDPAVADLLSPMTYPIGTKRICVDSNYFETFNRANVSIVDVATNPIETVTANGLRTTADEYEFDILVLATGFDAMTGSLLKMNITGVDGLSLKDKWAEGPKSYLGLGVHGFPNMFTITGPGSPSVLSNMIVSIEQHIEWICEFIASMRDNGTDYFEVDSAAEEQWVEHVNEVAAATLFPKAGSWYMGANIPGKPRIFMPYAGGVAPYRELCDDAAADHYRGFNIA
tara:strand:+ start:9389 stop:11059 length:1671 start_codon:yes stop_codon:yes gene_type:complete